MDGFEVIILLMFCSAILIGFAQKLALPYPIALVMGGTLIGFIPGLPLINFDPQLILVIVLPPILYYAAFGISFREFKKNWPNIFSLALGLVLITTLVIGLIFKWIFPQYPLALAFAFGAIVSPPDAVAATTILKRFSINSRLLTILEGESLVNDASALVLYRIAVFALWTGVFSFTESSLEFLKVASGGIVVGLLLGFLLQGFSTRFLDPIVGVVFSFTIPYITYIAANTIGVSGVLAVVVNGLIGSRFLAKHHSSTRRVVGFSVWDIFTVLMNCFVFILIGLQLRILTTTMSVHQMLLYSGYGVIFTVALILVRLMWVYARSALDYIKALHRPLANKICPQILNDAAIIGWSGMRGIVSLVAALALPLHFPNGTPIEGRNEVVFITFVVILLTLLIPALTLPLLLRFLGVKQHGGHHVSHRIRNQLTKIAEENILHLHASNKINKDEYEFLRSYFSLQRQVVEVTTSEHKRLKNLEEARLYIIKEQRKKLLDMWENQEIDDKLLTRLEHELDVEETRIARVELK